VTIPADSGRLARPVRDLRADALLEDAVHALSAADAPGLPVLGPAGREVVGWITHRDILRAYHQERTRLSAGSAVTPPRAPLPAGSARR
jgi:CBS domain-containing protein